MSFDSNLVISKCRYFDWGIDGNSANCHRFPSFQEDKPDCSKCDVYARIVADEIVRCPECKHFVAKGAQVEEPSEEEYVYEGSNAAESNSCMLLSRHDFDWDWTDWWGVTDSDYCSWGEKRK